MAMTAGLPPSPGCTAHDNLLAAVDSPAGLAAHGLHLLAQGQRVQALAPLRQAAAQLVKPHDLVGLAPVLYGLSQLHLQAGDLTGALQATLARVQLALQLADQRMRWRAVSGVALCQLLLGQHDAAQHSLHQALAGAREQADPALEAMVCNNLVWLAGCQADALQRAGQDRLSHHVLNQAEPHVCRADALGLAGSDYDRCLWRANRSGWLRRMGRLDDARDGYEAAYHQAVPADWVDVARHCALGLGQLLVQQGRVEPAQAWLVRCVAMADRPDPLGFVNQAHQLLAAQARQRGDGAAAQRHLQASARITDAVRRECRQLQDEVARVALDVAHLLSGPPRRG